jgi:hypothetical protein
VILSLEKPIIQRNKYIMNPDEPKNNADGIIINNPGTGDLIKGNNSLPSYDGPPPPPPPQTPSPPPSDGKK